MAELISWKKSRTYEKKRRNVSRTVDGRNTSQDITEHFAQMYQELYQRHEVGDEFKDIYQSIYQRIDEILLQDIDETTQHKL